MYENFVTQYTRLDRYGKEKFQDFANSGKFRTDDMCDLVHMFDVINDYFNITNVETYEDIGRLYASMNNLEYSGDEEKVDMKLKYEQLGRSVCEAHNGFFANGKFYGHIEQITLSCLGV